MEGRVRVEVLEEMEVMIVLLLAKFCCYVRLKDGEEMMEGETYGFLSIC
jgi:hypothetical protein